MYAKLESEALIKAPKYITVDDAHVWNATEEDYLSLGWYPVIYTDAPDTDDKHYAESAWTQESDCIRQTWTVIEIPEPTDEDEISDEDAMRILMGESL